MRLYTAPIEYRRTFGTNVVTFDFLTRRALSAYRQMRHAGISSYAARRIVTDMLWIGGLTEASLTHRQPRAVQP